MIDTTISTVPRELIQERVLKMLSLEITDLQDYTDKAVPDTYPRYQIYHQGRMLGTISKWGDKYHTKIIKNQRLFDSTYQAATLWVPPEILSQYEQKAEEELRIERDSMPNYF